MNKPGGRTNNQPTAAHFAYYPLPDSTQVQLAGQALLKPNVSGPSSRVGEEYPLHSDLWNVGHPFNGKL